MKGKPKILISAKSVFGRDELEPILLKACMRCKPVGHHFLVCMFNCLNSVCSESIQMGFSSLTIQ